MADGGEPRSARQRMEERILDGALQAALRHGVAKLAMSDVSEYAGVSRATAYRYFPNRDELLAELGRREAERFERQVWEALEDAPNAEERLDLVLDYVVRLAREHPLLRSLPETDPALVLTSLRARFPAIRETLHRLLAPLLERTTLVREGVVTSEQLVGWTARMMVSSFLFPEDNPEEMVAGIRAVYRRIQKPDGEESAGG
jgi:AcrR family transcriptional regulator